jgi:serine/threonine protein kinase
LHIKSVLAPEANVTLHVLYLTQLEQGSFGQLHTGLRQSQGGNFAVKVLSLCTKSSRGSSLCKPLTAAFQEVFIMRRLKHPNIVQYLGSEVKGYELFVMQEKVQGISVTALLSKDGPFSKGLAQHHSCSIQIFEYKEYINISINGLR